MTGARIDQQLHGYRNGHQLLSGSARLAREDQDTVDRLSDLSGPLRPGETFSPYLTTYPLPSGIYYVVARTWQDLGAPRAGCVLTRSLLVPMEAWEHCDAVEPLTRLLAPIASEERAAVLQLKPTVTSLPPVDDPRTVELVEALFLENRQPIVVFEAAQAEVMALRILTAVWPSFRRNFSICTFAIAPRKIDDRDFDLVFAPKSARTRFSDWSGRRIDVGGAGKPRHRWSSATAAHVFQSEEPNLAAHDALGILGADPRGDESALRLSLLWNELSKKASSTPTAVLGLLDILNSQRDSAHERFERLAPQIERTLERVTDEFSQLEAWHFLSTLVGKFPEEKPPERIAHRIERSAQLVARRNPAAALKFVDAESRDSRTIPTTLLLGLAAGLSGSAETLSAGFRKLLPHVGVRLLALSAPLTRAVVLAAKREPIEWLAVLKSALLNADRDARRRIRVNATPELDDANIAPLLGPLLEGATASELTDVVVSIGRKTNFEIGEFDEPLGNAARDESSLRDLRTAVVIQFDSPGADRFLLSTMRIDAADIAWLCTEVPERRSSRLLTRLLAMAPDRTLIAAQRDLHTRERMLKTLSSDLSIGASQAARLLTLGDISTDQFLLMGERLIPYLSGPERDALADHLLARALEDAALGDPRISGLVEAAQGRPALRNLVRLATPEGASSERIAENLVILEGASEGVRQQIVAQADELSDRLVHLAQSNLGDRAYHAWANLVAVAPNEDVQFRAASLTLSFAFRHPRLPVSPLIIASFPVVYAQLLRSKDGDEKTIPAFFALPMSFFIDWDRAKSARRELADAYLDSTWPPADLLVTAMEAGIENDTLDRLSRSAMGRNYLNAIGNDIARLPHSIQKKAYDSLRQFFT